jgi:CheY-like chemotaxis protein
LRDQGPGIDPENRQRVFDPFFSTKGADGMGLAYAAAVIRAHGGRLEIESTAQEGCTIAVHLPVNVRLILEGAASPEAVLPPLTPHRPTNKARVLFMDDDAQIRDLVAKILTTHGFDVYLTKNGQEAMDAYRKAKEFGAPFDVILMDLDVRGGMGGIEATSRLRAEYPHLKALLTTGYVDDGLLESHRDHGFAGVILKPFQVERLVGTISKLVGLETA